MDMAFNMHLIKFNKSIAATLVCGMLTACGSGGESNTAPTISVADATFKERVLVTVPATFTDPDGSISKISWVQKSGVAATLVDASNATLTFKAPDVSKDETLVFTVSVTDNAGAVASKDVTVTVKNNLLPSVSVTNSSVGERKTGQLQATATDSDGTIVSYAWTQKSGTAATLTTATSNTLSFTAPVVSQDETLVFTVKATDDTGEFVEKDVQVLVVNNRVPTIDVSNVNTRERAAAQLQMKATDADGSVVSYSWTQKSGTKATVGNTNEAVLNFTAPVVTQDEVLVFTATATDDSGESSSKDVQVAVKNNQLPVITANNANVRELAAVTLTAAATDSDGTVAGYKWTQKSGLSATLTNTNAATLSFTAPNTTKDEVLTFTVEATDNEGDVSSKDVTVNVANNKAPTIAISDFSINEKMPVSVVPTITDAEGDAVTVRWTQKSGLAITNSTLSGNSYNFMAPDISKKNEVLVFTITATDALGDITTKDVSVTLVANVEKLTFSGMMSVSTTASKYPVVGPKVTIQVGGSNQTVDATSATGSYTAEVVIDEKDYNEQVRIIAEAQSPTYFKLVSELGNIQDVLGLAGSDKLITSQDHSGLWVTEATTALHGLMQLANNNQPITTKDQFQAAQLAYDGSKLLDVALAIKLISEYQQPYPGLIPPSGFGDTEALSRDLTRVAKYLAKANAELPTLVKQSKASLIAEKIAAVTDINAIRANYYLQQVELSGEGEFISLGNNGGFFADSQVSAETRYVTAGNGEIAIDYYPTAAGQGLVAYPAQSVYVNNIKVQEVKHLQSTKLKFVDISPNAGTVLMQHTYVKKYPNTNLADVTVVEDYVARKALKSITETNTAGRVFNVGATYLLPVPMTTDAVSQAHPNAEGYQRKELRFKPLTSNQAELSRVTFDGSGRVSSETVNATYSIGPMGTMDIKPQGTVFPSTIMVSVWNVATPAMVSVRAVANGKSTTTHGPLVKQETAWTPSSVPGIYDFGTSFATPNNYAWVEFNADGTAWYVSTVDYNNDGVLSNNEFRLVTGLWQVRNDGSLVVRRYRNPADFCTSTIWDTAIGDSCILNEERVWSPYQQSGNTYVLNVLRYTYFDFWARQSLQAPWTSVVNITKDAVSLNRTYTKVATRPIAIPAGVVANAQGQELQTYSEPVQIPLLQQKEAARELHFD